MCKCVLPPGDNPIAVNKYIKYISRNVSNSSEDGVCKLIVVWRVEVGIFWKVWHLIGTFCFDILVDLKIVFVKNVFKWNEVN